MERQLTDEPIKHNRQCRLITGAYLDDEPNAAVMSVAEEAGVTHLNPPSETLSDICQVHTKSLSDHRSRVIVITR